MRAVLVVLCLAWCLAAQVVVQPVAWWKCDDPGSFLLDSGPEIDGPYEGTYTDTGVAHSPATEVNQACCNGAVISGGRFPVGSGATITSANKPLLVHMMNGSTDFAVFLRVFPTNIAGSEHFLFGIGAGTSVARGWFISINTQGGGNANAFWSLATSSGALGGSWNYTQMSAKSKAYYNRYNNIYVRFTAATSTWTLSNGCSETRTVVAPFVAPVSNDAVRFVNGVPAWTGELADVLVWGTAGTSTYGATIPAAATLCDASGFTVLLPSSTPSPTRSASPTPSATASRTAEPSVSATAAPTLSMSVSLTAEPSQTAAPSTSLSPSVGTTPTATPTPSSSSDPTRTPTASQTPTPSSTKTASISLTPLATPTSSWTVSVTAVPSVSLTHTPDVSVSQSQTLTPTFSPSPTAFPTNFTAPVVVDIRLTTNGSSLVITPVVPVEGGGAAPQFLITFYLREVTPSGAEVLVIPLDEMPQADDFPVLIDHLPDSYELAGAPLAKAGNATLSQSSFYYSATTQVPFGDQTLTVDALSYKFAVAIESWPFASEANILQLVLRTAPQDSATCKSSLTRAGDDDVLELQLSDGTIFRGAFFRFGQQDENAALVKIQNTQINQFEVAVEMPYFARSMVLDPSFQVLVDGTVKASGTQCDEKSKKTDETAIIVGIVVPIGVFCCVCVMAIVLLAVLVTIWKSGYGGRLFLAKGEMGGADSLHVSGTASPTD